MSRTWSLVACLFGVWLFTPTAAHAGTQCYGGIYPNCSSPSIVCNGVSILTTPPITMNCAPTCAAAGQTPSARTLTASATGSCGLAGVGGWPDCLPSITWLVSIDGSTGNATVTVTAVSQGFALKCYTIATTIVSSTCNGQCCPG